MKKLKVHGLFKCKSTNWIVAPGNLERITCLHCLRAFAKNETDPKILQAIGKRRLEVMYQNDPAIRKLFAEVLKRHKVAASKLGLKAA